MHCTYSYILTLTCEGAVCTVHKLYICTYLRPTYVYEYVVRIIVRSYLVIKRKKKCYRVIRVPTLHLLTVLIVFFLAQICARFYIRVLVCTWTAPVVRGYSDYLLNLLYIFEIEFVQSLND